MATVDKIVIMRTDGSGEERDISAKTAGVATKAEYDMNGKSLTGYVSAVEKTATDLKVTKGNGAVSTLSMKMTGATSQSNGAAGFVPQPLINDRNRVLSGAGTWIDKVGYVGLSGVSGTQSLNVDGSKITIPYASYASSAGSATNATNASSASNGISSFSKSGNTYTIRLVNGTSYQITDTNTTYSAGDGIRLASNIILNAGIRDIQVTHYGSYGQVEINKNGTWSTLDIPHADRADQAGYLYVSDDAGAGSTCQTTVEVQPGDYVSQVGRRVDQRLCVQHDYNLVLYKGDSATWSSGTSSRRFKHNIQSMTEERAKKILDIRAVTFDWNDDQVITTQKNDNAGVIAEEVSKVIPDVVVFEAAGDDGERIERRVEYERFTPYLIKLAQMQQKQIEALTKRVEELEANK